MQKKETKKRNEMNTNSAVSGTHTHTKSDGWKSDLVSLLDKVISKRRSCDKRRRPTTTMGGTE